MLGKYCTNRATSSASPTPHSVFSFVLVFFFFFSWQGSFEQHSVLFRISVANKKGVPVAHPTWGFLFVGCFYPLTVSYEKTFKFNPHEVRPETMCVSLLSIHLLFSKNEAGSPICRYCERDEQTSMGKASLGCWDETTLTFGDRKDQERPGKNLTQLCQKQMRKIEARQSDLAKVNMGY